MDTRHTGLMTGLGRAHELAHASIARTHEKTNDNHVVTLTIVMFEYVEFYTNDKYLARLMSVSRLQHGERV